MRNVTILLAVLAVMVWAVAPAGATPSDPYTLADTSLASVVDPTGGPADVDKDAIDMGTLSGSGTLLSKTNWNALSGMYVVDFNDANNKADPAKEQWTGGSQGSGTSTGLTKIEATYSGTKRVDFSNVDTGTDKFSTDGYNYGGYYTAGRKATSGTEDYHTMGLLDGATDDVYQHDGTAGVLLHMSIAMDNAPGEYVSGVAFCFIGRDSDEHKALTATFTLSDDTTASINVGDVGGSAGSADDPKDVLFAYQAPTGKSITSFKITHSTETGYYADGFSALDDLGFQVVPEPATLALLGIGGIGVLIRRKRR